MHLVERLLEAGAMVVIAPRALAAVPAVSVAVAAWATPAASTTRSAPPAAPEERAHGAEDQEEEEEEADEPEEREAVAPAPTPATVVVRVGDRSDRGHDRSGGSARCGRGDRGREPGLVGRLGDDPAADDECRDDEKSDEEIAHGCVSSF